MRGRPGARRRSLRAVSVAAATWTTAGVATLIPDAAPLTVALALAACVATALLAWRGVALP